ncbi:MAG: 6-phosphofructokinase, partial [Bacteroidota bacterium]|nr:6-phosphofructokinase [Bacteroidota bacterium]MDX5430548.1 6-phosphofructokinase [Bacteroidota bacterium]MDX5469300.1 6-phosphofructokinase [Bacteroidota bacterium]
KAEVYGIRRGYQGMIEGDIIPMNSLSVANIIQRGGTILKTARSQEFMTPEGRSKAAANLKKLGIEGLVCIGGNGSFTGAMKLQEEHGIACIGAPGTIDNDLYGTDYTIGFDTAINTALEAIDRIRDTADSHNRTFFIEVMGRDAGFIALHAGLAGGAEAIFIPEQENRKNWIDQLFNEKRRKKSFSIIVVAEGEEEGGAISLVKKVQEKYPNIDPRVTILGHIQRGGTPTAFDRVLASRMGSAAVDALMQGKTSLAVGICKDEINFTPFDEAIHKRKGASSDLIRLVRILNA